MLNDTLLALISNDSGASKIPPRRAVDAAPDLDPPALAASEFAALFEAGFTGELGDAASRAASDNPLSSPIPMAVSNVRPPNEGGSGAFKIIDSDDQTGVAEAIKTSPELSSLATQQQRSAKSLTEIEPSLKQERAESSTPNEGGSSAIKIIDSDDQTGVAEAVKTSPEISGLATQQKRSAKSVTEIEPNLKRERAESSTPNAVPETALIAATSPTQLTLGQNAPRGPERTGHPASEVSSGNTGPFLGKREAPPAASQRLLPAEARLPPYAAPATEITLSSAYANDAVGGKATQEFGELSPPQIVEEIQNPDSVARSAVSDFSIAISLDRRSSISAAGTASETGLGQAIVEQDAPTRAFQFISLSKLTDKDFELRLDPPDLGSVSLHFFEDDAGVQRATITSERSDTLDLMRRHSDVLQRELARAGAGNIELGFQERRGDDRRDDRPSDERITRIGSAPQHLVVQHESLTLLSGNGRIDRFA